MSLGAMKKTDRFGIMSAVCSRLMADFRMNIRNLHIKLTSVLGYSDGDACMDNRAECSGTSVCGTQEGSACWGRQDTKGHACRKKEGVGKHTRRKRRKRG